MGMDVRPVGGGPPPIDPIRAPGQVHSVARPAGLHLDAAVFGELSPPDLTRLVAIIEPVLSAQDSARLNNLLHNAVAAAAEGDAARALDHIAAAMVLDPTRADTVRAAPELEKIRPQVEQLIARLQATAKMDAEGRLSLASRRVDLAGSQKLAEWNASPAAVMVLANRLFEAGGHVNYVRAAALAQALIDPAHWAPAETPVTASVAGRPQPKKEKATAPGRLRRLWDRAPLLILLVAWLALGLGGGLAAFVWRRYWPDSAPEWIDTAFEVWGMGFVVLILFGFYMRIRRIFN